jgi:hypothetical protein
MYSIGTGKAPYISSWAFNPKNFSTHFSLLRTEVKEQRNTSIVWNNWWFVGVPLFIYPVSILSEESSGPHGINVKVPVLVAHYNGSK